MKWSVKFIQTDINKAGEEVCSDVKRQKRVHSDVNYPTEECFFRTVFTPRVEFPSSLSLQWVYWVLNYSITFSSLTVIFCIYAPTCFQNVRFVLCFIILFYSSDLHLNEHWSYFMNYIITVGSFVPFFHRRNVI